ncbi:hypothetical protein C2648_002847, partial [Salmonella enterica subsp. enterica serovar 4,[5],12:i:-]|nr:hypothetical protein [Salmonella enterica]EDS0800627.1 hypothetical protein [Salmonella enterica subsp. enterica serovar Bareilly]EDT9082001.1 hypothetical protein [Salmonella enterica subsp. enterica serovar Typhimurium var. 5-]EDX8087654.1 hypothetical protein [Salmonella enterica subsp. enterica serovar 4,[5],12:i:-]EEK9642900.1 hypothetical protein [Salmonella enterica subsp. enterica serovar Infantis]
GNFDPMISLCVFGAEAMHKQATTAERLIKAGGVHENNQVDHGAGFGALS